MLIPPAPLIETAAFLVMAIALVYLCGNTCYHTYRVVLALLPIASATSTSTSFNPVGYLPLIIGVFIIFYILRKLKLLATILIGFGGLFAAYIIISLVPALQVEPLWPMLKSFVESFPQMISDVWSWFKENFSVVV